MTIRILLLLLASAALTGCTGTQVTVKPDPKTLSLSNLARYENVGLSQASTGGGNYAAAGNLAEGLSTAMKSAGFAQQVYYPLRPDDKTDIALNTEFSVKTDAHMGANLAKSIFTGLTLFLLEPALWYDYDYILEGKAIISKRGQRIGEATAHTDATISMKWLSLSELPNLEAEALTKAKQSLYSQLMREIHY